MPEPISAVFDIHDPQSTADFVASLVRTTIKKDSAINEGRKGMFGNGLMKSLSQNEKGAQARAEKVFDFFRALSTGDAYQIGRLSETYASESKSMLDAGSLTPWEFKTLAPANEGTNSAGGYTVPIEWAADLTRNLGKYGFARRYLRPYQMSRKTLDMAGLLTKPSVALVAEGAAIAASKPVLDQLVLTAKKVAAIYPATNELLEDANIDTYAIMLEIYTEQFQIFEDTSAFQNANTNWPGLLWYGAGAITSGIAANGARAYSRTNSTSGGATGYPQMSDAASTTDAWFDHLLMLQGQPSALFEGGKFFIDQNVLVAMLAMRDSNKRFLADLDTSLAPGMGLEGQTILRYRGYEVVPLPSGIMFTYDASAHASAPFSVFCNPQRCWAMMGTRGGFFVDQSKDGTVDTVSAFENDLTLWRMKERIAFGVGRPETMAVLRTDAS